MTSRKKVLAVASFGGHWVQLMRLRPAWDESDVTYVATSRQCGDEVFGYAAENGLPEPGFISVPEANRHTPFRLIAQFICVAWAVLRTRPDVVITTGATAGLMGIFVGRLIGAKTAWLDSIANAEEMSLSGSHAGRFVDLWLTQWPHLASAEGPSHAGSVI